MWTDLQGSLPGRGRLPATLGGPPTWVPVRILCPLGAHHHTCEGEEWG